MRGEKQHPVASLLRTSIGGKHWMVTISTTNLPQVGEEEQVFLSYSEGRGPPCSLQPPPRTPSCRASVCVHTFVLFSHTSAFFSSKALHLLLQLSCFPQLLEDLEHMQDTSTLDLSTWTCRRNFPSTFIIPGTTVNSWLGNWVNLLELFISQVLFF